MRKRANSGQQQSSTQIPLMTFVTTVKPKTAWTRVLRRMSMKATLRYRCPQVGFAIKSHFKLITSFTFLFDIFS